MQSIACALAVAICGAAAAAQSEPGDAPPRAFGAFAFQIDRLEEPRGAAVADDGSIFMVESAAARVRVFDRAGVEQRSFGAPGELLEPCDVELFGDDALLIADSGAHRVGVFGCDGTPRSSFGKLGAALGEFNEPRGLAADAERIYVADSKNDRVQVFDRSFTPLFSIGSRGKDQGRFNLPLDVAVDDAGNVYVADAENARVQVFDRERRFARAFGDFGPFPGQFAYPSSLQVAAGKLFVADRDNHRVAIVSLGGKLLDEWGVHALRPREGEGKLHYVDGVALSTDASFAIVCEGFEDRAQAFGPLTGGADVGATLPQARDASAHFGLGVAAAGDLMAAIEPAASAIVLYRLTLPEPIQVTQAGVRGSRVGQMLRPADAAIALERREVLVSDPANRRINAYKIVGDVDGEVGYDPYMLRFSRSLDFEELHRRKGDDGATWAIEPAGLALEGDRLLVADASNRRVWILDERFALAGSFGSGSISIGDVASSPLDRRRYVADPLAGVVRIYDGEGEPRGELGDPRLSRPFGVAVDERGVVSVSDLRNDHVVRFDRDGRCLGPLGKPGLGRNEFQKPAGLAIDGRGELVVIDYGNHRGHVIGRDDQSLGYFGSRLFTRAFREPR